MGGSFEESSEEHSGVSESELNDEEIKNGELRLKISEGVFRCPFCQGKWKPNYTYKELLQHASEVAKESHKNIKLRDNHLALAKYLEGDLTQFTVENECIVQHDCDEVFVIPWIGIIVNIDGKYFGEGGFRLRDQLTKKGFNPVNVTPLWDCVGHSGMAIVEFHKDLPGFHHAMLFEKSFEVDHHGKRDWRAKKKPASSSIYGWVARDDDYNNGDIIGEHLRANGVLNLNTIAGVAEEERRTNKLVTELASLVEVKNQQLEEIEYKYLETKLALQDVKLENDRLHRTCDEEKKKMQMNASNHLQRIFHENENPKSATVLDSRRKEFQWCGMSVLDVQNCMKDYFLQNATLEQKKAGRNALSCIENLHKRMLELEMQLYDKQALELDFARLKVKLSSITQLRVEEDVEVQRKTDEMSKNLKEKEDELEDLEALNLTITMKERKSNDELQEARKKLIDALKQNSSRAMIGVKRMGEIDTKPFLVAGNTKYAEEANEKSIEICSLWQDHLRDSSWHPFKIVEVGKNHEEIIDAEDEKLSDLRKEWGEDVYTAVTTALMEMNEYNASGRYPTPELWNFREGRRATMTEGITYILRQKKKWRFM